MNNEAIRKFYNKSKIFIFPLALLLFALLKVNKGVDLTDASYSLGNYRFFKEGSGIWFLLTYLSNVTGYIFTLLPGGSTMLGMKVYCSLIVGLMGIVGYRFFMTKMPAWLAFIAEAVAIGMCWAPTVILYNYLTYFFLLLGCVFLFRGLAGCRNRCLIIAGFFLGINAFVRFPNNGLEVLLIIALVYYCVIERMPSKEIVNKALLCVLGYAIGFGILLICVSLTYGWDSLGNMISGALGISGSASDYTLGQMIHSILDAYWHGFKWALYLIICAILGIPFMLLFEDKYIRLRKIVYVLCIAFLFFVLYKWGMYNFKYYQKESALQWGAIFLLISIVISIWLMLSRRFNNDWKLIGCISLIIILITPLGSNNYIWPALNNLFFVAPLTAWIIYLKARWGRKYLDATRKVPLFSVKAMVSAAVIMFAIQAIGVGCAYVFLDGEDGSEPLYAIENNSVLKGMRTNASNADSLTELSTYFAANQDIFGADRKLILYGNIPGISYYLDCPSALNTTWSDLASNPLEDMQAAISKIDASDPATRPIVILGRGIYDCPDNSIKLDMINQFIDEYEYAQTFINAEFVIFE